MVLYNLIVVGIYSSGWFIGNCRDRRKDMAALGAGRKSKGIVISPAAK
jgi:hypothetical protein